jgi:transcription antitermination factor NusG
VEFEIMTLPWYAVYTRSRWEHRIADALRQKGFEVFLPTYSTQKPTSRGNIGILPPLFPGYLFCRLDITNRLPVLVVNGVISILGVGQVPEPVPENELDAVRKVMASGLAISPDAVLSPGQSVLVEHGPLKGVTGTLIHTMKESLLLVSISLLNRSVAVRLKPEWVTSGNALRALVASKPVQFFGQVAMR